MKIKFYYMQKKEKEFIGDDKELLNVINTKDNPSFENEIRCLSIDNKVYYFDNVYELYNHIIKNNMIQLEE